MSYCQRWPTIGVAVAVAIHSPALEIPTAQQGLKAAVFDDTKNAVNVASGAFVPYCYIRGSIARRCYGVGLNIT